MLVVEGVELNNQITESRSYKLYFIIPLLTDSYEYLSIVEQFNKKKHTQKKHLVSPISHDAPQHRYEGCVCVCERECE